jgi:hypothetical protein
VAEARSSYERAIELALQKEPMLLRTYRERLARDHDHPQEGIALAEAAIRDDERRSVRARITIGAGKGDANHFPLFKARQSRRDPPRYPIR